MPLPRWLARFNRRVSNRILGPAAGRVPYVALVEHRGRTSGRRYRTPVTAFPQGDVVIFAIIYGTASDWVRNVLAAGGCEAVYRSRRLQLIAPRLVGRPEGEAAIPGPVRLVLRLLRVQNFLVLQARRD